jgi:hypothetical protein
VLRNQKMQCSSLVFSESGCSGCSTNGCNPQYDCQLDGNGECHPHTPSAMVRVYCDQSTDDGGWMLVGASSAPLRDHGPGPGRAGRLAPLAFSIVIRIGFAWRVCVGAQGA